MNLETDGCCGQQQRVVCNATETNRISVKVENHTSLYEFQLIRAYMDDGFIIHLVEVTKLPFLYQFIVEVVFIATESVTVTCNSAAQESLTVNVDSKLNCRGTRFLYAMRNRLIKPYSYSLGLCSMMLFTAEAVLQFYGYHFIPVTMQ